MTPPVPKCRHRGQQIADNRWICHSEKLVIPGRVIGGDFCRDDCPYVDHAEQAKSSNLPVGLQNGIHPDLPVADFIKRIATPNREFPPDWPRWQIAQIAHRQLLDESAATTLKYPDGFCDRGIVIGAGGPVYFACALVCVKVLRRLGCTLPVEFWYLGETELDQQRADAVKPLGVTCHDATAIMPRPRILNGWELKPFSIIHSRFEQVLYLDADNVPARDPTYLFDDKRFIESGAVFWPDLPPIFNPNEWIPRLTWDIAAISRRDRTAFESGQILVDKSKCWHELAVTMHINEHSDFWYKYVYGDKDTFKLAWHKLNREYAMPSRQSDWLWPAIFQFDLDDELVFTHACQGKQQLMNGERLPALPNCALAVEAASELKNLAPVAK